MLLIKFYLKCEGSLLFLHWEEKLFFFLYPGRDNFSPVLGHSQNVVKREIKSLSSYIIHPWPWGTSCCSSSSATSHFSSFQLQTSTCPRCGQCTDAGTFSIISLWRCEISWEILSFVCLFASWRLFPLWCWCWFQIRFRNEINMDWSCLQVGPFWISSTRPPIVWVGWDSEPWDNSLTTLLTTKSSMWGKACKS